MQMADLGAKLDEGEKGGSRTQLYYYMTPVNIGDGQTQGIRSIWMALQEVTSAHGLPSFSKSRGRHQRMFYLTVTFTRDRLQNTE